MAEVDLGKSLQEALAVSKHSGIQSLQELADWCIKFGNFYILLDELQKQGKTVLMTQEMLLQFTRLVMDQYGAAIAYAIQKTKALGESVVVELDASAQNLPVDIIDIRKYKDKIDEILDKLKVKPSEEAN